MALAPSFSLNGSNPLFQSPSSNYGGLLGGSTPASSALNKAQGGQSSSLGLLYPQPQPAKPTTIPGSTIPGGQTPPSIPGSYIPSANMSTNNGPAVGGVGNATPAATPAPAMKSQTITKTDYHPPTSGMISPSSDTNPNAGQFGTGGINNTTNSPAPSTPTPTGTAPTYPGLIGSLSTFDPFSNPAVLAAYQKAQAINAEIAQSKKNQAAGEASQLGAPIPLGDATGRQQITRNQYLQQQAALSDELQGQTNLFNAGFTGTGQQLSALGQAGTLSTPANQFMQVPYSNQIIGANGQPVTGGAAGQLPAAGQSFVNDLAQQVKNGQMTRAEAESRLSTYGQPALQALNTALGTGFNTNASNASAGTTATGQQIQTAASSTNKALDTLATAFNSLPGAQTGGIPLTNSIAQWIGTNLGSSALQTYKTNLADARSQLIGVLNSAGGTPTGNEATAEQYLPDNMTAAQFQQNVGTVQNPGIVRQLISQKVGSFTSSGNQQANTGGGVSAGGYTFVQDASGKWIPAQ